MYNGLLRAKFIPALKDGVFFRRSIKNSQKEVFEKLSKMFNEIGNGLGMPDIDLSNFNSSNSGSTAKISIQDKDQYAEYHIDEDQNSLMFTYQGNEYYFARIKCVKDECALYNDSDEEAKKLFDLENPIDFQPKQMYKY